MKIQDAARHRNGVGGAPFYVALFTDERDEDVEGKQMIGITFPEYDMATAVFDLELLSQGVIAFMENSFRGDYFDAELRRKAEKFVNAKWKEQGV